MSVHDRTARLRDWYTETDTVRAVGRVVFGDGYGLALFLGSLCFFMLYWRIGVFITDTNAIATTLLNVADGRLFLTEAPYGSGLESPGTYVSGDRVYGRNYGIVFVALPVLWLLEGLAVVADTRVVLVALWCLLVLGFTVSVSRYTERRWVVPIGNALAVSTFLTSLTVATPLAPLARPVIALQLVTMVATGLAGVSLYRLLSHIHDRRCGLFAGAGLVIATPIGFWASLPKRHSFTVLALLAICYTLYRSRSAENDRATTRNRAVSYVFVGLFAWVHAAEALLLLIALVVVDLPTADNDRRSLAVVGGAFLCSLLPFFLTNLLISGNPIEPPRLLTPYGQTTGTGLASGGGPSGGFFTDTIVGQVIAKGISVLTALGSRLLAGFLVLTTDGGRVYNTFVRSGYIASVASEESGLAISLTVLEAAPLLGAAVGFPVAVVGAVRAKGVGRLRSHLGTPVGVVDGFAACSGLLFTLLFMPQLPLHAQVTVRYFHPLFAVGVYGLARLLVTREMLAEHWRTSLWTYAASVLIGGQLVFTYLALTGPTLGEAVQFHALLALGVATVLGLWTLAATVSDAVPRVYGGVAFGLAAGAGTLFILLSGLFYFDYAGQFMLPVVRVVTDAVTLTA